MENYYVPLKLKNPKLPILLRECSGIIPKIHARYGMFVVDFVIVTNQSIDRSELIIQSQPQRQSINQAINWSIRSSTQDGLRQSINQSINPP